MAGPLSGIGGQTQQIPLSNSFQPGQSNNTQVRPEEKKQAETNIVQPRRSQPASSQSIETGNQDVLKTASSGSSSRGSLIDITV